jgi:hypothetical protein
MRNTLAFIGAVVVTVAGAGWYLDWYQVRTNPAPTGRRSFNVEIDTVKIGDDIQKGGARIQEVLEKRRQEAEAKAKTGGAKESRPLDPAGPEEESEEFVIDPQKPR